MYFETYYTELNLENIVNSNVIINNFINKFITKNKTYNNAIIYGKYYCNYKNYNCNYNLETMKILFETINE